MKTLIEKSTRLSKFIIEDSIHVDIQENHVLIPDLKICDMNLNNSELIEDVTPPEDWEGNKYCCIDGEFILAEDYRREQARNALFIQLRSVSSEVSSLIYQARLVNNPEPEQLTALIEGFKDMYNKAKLDIAALEGNRVFEYKIQSPELELASAALKSFL